MVVSFKLNILQAKNGLFFFNINFFYSEWHKASFFVHGSRSHLVFVFSCSEAHSTEHKAHGASSRGVSSLDYRYLARLILSALYKVYPA